MNFSKQFKAYILNMKSRDMPFECNVILHRHLIKTFKFLKAYYTHLKKMKKVI